MAIPLRCQPLHRIPDIGGVLLVRFAGETEAFDPNFQRAKAIFRLHIFGIVEAVADRHGGIGPLIDLRGPIVPHIANPARRLQALGVLP